MNKMKYSELFYSIQGEGRYVGVPSVFLRVFGCNFECAGFGQSRDKSEWIPKEEMAHSKDYPDAKTLDELPVPDIGCDSSFSWSAKHGHLATKEDAKVLIEKINELLVPGAHLVITGGEPLLKGFHPFMLELLMSPELNTSHITFETNGTQVFPYYMHFTHRYYLFSRKITWSVSPKISISGESFEDAIKPDALLSYNQWPNSYLYLKIVIRDEHDIDEVKKVILTYKEKFVNIECVYLMPEGATDTGKSLTENKVVDLCMKHGYRFSPRLHIDLFGNKWGT